MSPSAFVWGITRPGETAAGHGECRFSDIVRFTPGTAPALTVLHVNVNRLLGFATLPHRSAGWVTNRIFAEGARKELCNWHSQFGTGSLGPAPSAKTDQTSADSRSDEPRLLTIPPATGVEPK